MIGAIIGDIVGSRFEFDNHLSTEFDLFAKGCGYTDDTICTVAVAEAILNQEDMGQSIHDWCAKHPYPQGGYGGSFHRWVHSNDPQPYGSFGNGSAMRVSPCGYLTTTEEVLSYARLSAECTHNHLEGIKGAQAIAMCVYMARNKASKQDIKEMVNNQFGYDLNQTCDEIRRTNSFSEICQVTVPQAIICFLESTDFETAIRLAISIGGDSDTMGAMTGAIAEAYYGVPDDIRAQAMNYLDDEMICVIDKFEERYEK